MTLVIYTGSGSPYVWRALLGLEVKGLAYEAKLLSFSNGEHKTSEYLAINPRGRVPALVEGDRVTTESLAILSRLDELKPEPALFGATAAARTQIIRVISDIVYYVEPPIAKLARPIFAGSAAESADAIAEGARTLASELQGLEATLAHRPWLAGAHISAADLCAYPHLMIALRAAGKEAAAALDLGLLPLGDKYPRLSEWKDRIETLPGYARTYPPHWREA